MKQDAVIASLESLIRDKAQSYRLGAFATGKATRSLSGITRSVFKGRGMDFDEVREYQQGDDTGQIDWRVTARQGHPFTKIFKEEKEESKTDKYEIGNVIIHKKYGRGTVVKTIKYEERQLLQIEFDEAGKKLLDPTVADIKLEQ